MWCRVERGVVTTDVSQTLTHLHGEHSVQQQLVHNSLLALLAIKHESVA